MKFGNRFPDRKRDGSSHSCPSRNEEKTPLLPAGTNDQLPASEDEYYNLNKTLKGLKDLQSRLEEFQSSKDSTLIQGVLLSLEKVIAGQDFMLSNLKQLKSGKLKRIKVLFRRRKIIKAIFFTVFVGMVLCVCITVAMHAPPLLAALPAAATTVLSFGPLTSWVDKGNVWQKEVRKIETDLETVRNIYEDTNTLTRELHKIKIMLESLINQQTRSASDQASMNYMDLGHLMEKIGKLVKQLSEITETAEIKPMRKRWLERFIGCFS